MRGIFGSMAVKESRATHVAWIPSKKIENVDGGYNLQTSSRLGGLNVTF